MKQQKEDKRRYWTLFNAIICSCEESYISYDTSEPIWDLQGEDIRENQILPSLLQNPEQFMITKNLISALSEDARWLLDTIYSNPELVATQKLCNVTRQSVMRYLMRKKKWSRRKTEKVFNQIRQVILEAEM